MRDPVFRKEAGFLLLLRYNHPVDTSLKTPSLKPTVTPDAVWAVLKTVMDPELNVDIVSLGLIYDVSVSQVQTPSGAQPYVYVLMTLTTPGCPLSAVFDTMLREAMRAIPGLDVEQAVNIELTFDPPWVPDMMSEESRAELGFD